MLYLCCTKLGITLVNPLFIGYCKAIYDKPVLAFRWFTSNSATLSHRKL